MPERLLILEGHPIICECLQKAFKRREIYAKCFTDPLEAIAEFVKHMEKKQPFSTVYVDCDLPNEAGQRMAEAIRSIEGNAPKAFTFPRVKIIGNTDRPWFGMEDGEKFGMDVVVEKPLNFKAYLEVLFFRNKKPFP